MVGAAAIQRDARSLCGGSVRKLQLAATQNRSTQHHRTHHLQSSPQRRSHTDKAAQIDRTKH